MVARARCADGAKASGLIARHKHFDVFRLFYANLKGQLVPHCAAFSVIYLREEKGPSLPRTFSHTWRRFGYSDGVLEAVGNCGKLARLPNKVEMQVLNVRRRSARPRSL